MSFNINNISYDDFKDICRMCMLNCDVKFSRNSVISTIFLKLTDFHFETNDDLPKQICRNCFEKINEIHEFALKCKQTHSALLECLNNQKNVNQNESIEIKENPIIIDKNVIIDQFKNEYVEDISLNLIDKVEINYKLNDIIPVTSEISENIDLQNTSNNLTEEITIEEHKIEFVKHEHVFDEINNESEDDLLLSNNQSSEIKSKEDTVYKCDVCYKTFTYFNVFKKHKSLSDCKRPFKCDQCSKSFKLLIYLKNHGRQHSGERPFKCDQCSKSFNNSGSLCKHRRTHTGERPFKCDQCLKSFTELGSLRKHVRAHSGERPFKCDQCFKSFKQLSHMQAHLRTHNGERLFSQSNHLINVGEFA